MFHRFFTISLTMFIGLFLQVFPFVFTKTIYDLIVVIVLVCSWYISCRQNLYTHVQHNITVPLMDYERPYGVDDVQHFESSVLLPIAVDYLLPIHDDAPERIVCKNHIYISRSHCFISSNFKNCAFPPASIPVLSPPILFPATNTALTVLSFPIHLPLHFL